MASLDMFAKVWSMSNYISYVFEIVMESLNKQRPFKSTGDDFSESNPIFAFYFYKYYLDAVVNIFKDLQDSGEQGELGVEMKEVQAKMQMMKDKCGHDLQEQKNLADILEYTEGMFAKNDHSYREGVRSRQLAEVSGE